MPEVRRRQDPERDLTYVEKLVGDDWVEVARYDSKGRPVTYDDVPRNPEVLVWDTKNRTILDLASEKSPLEALLEKYEWETVSLDQLRPGDLIASAGGSLVKVLVPPTPKDKYQALVQIKRVKRKP